MKTTFNTRLTFFMLLLIVAPKAVFAQPTANFSATTVCLGEQTVFTNGSTEGGSNIVSHTWDFGDGEGSPVVSPKYTFASSGTHIVTLTVVDANGDEATINKNVIIHPKASVNFSLNGSDRCVSVAQSFQNLSTISSGSISSYSWNFGDATTSTATNPSHTYTNPGTYTVSLTAISNNS
ncbi:MAG: PKD domain-containing protein, partial [Marinoscillum sp.]